MPWITVFGLPDNPPINTPAELVRSINAAALSIQELGLKSNGSEVTIFFSTDVAGKPFNKQVVVKIELLEGQRRTEDVQARLTKAVGMAVKEVLPDMEVDCFPVTVKRRTFWSSSS